MRVTAFLSGASLVCFAFGVAQVPAQSCAPPPPNAVSWWPGDGSAADIVGVNDGTLVNGATYGTGHVTSGNGQAFLFDGIDDYVDIGTDSSLDIAGGDHSVSVWLKWTLSTGNARAVINLGAFNQKMMLSTSFNPQGQDHVAYAHFDGTGPWADWYYNAGSGLNDGNWHHIAAVKSGSDVAIYVDGSLVPYTSGGTVVIANHNRLGTGIYNAFAGSVDELCIWDRALLQAEVEKIYNAGTAGKCKSGCQTDLGFQGPGTAWATLCGTGLNEGESSDYEILGAPDSGAGALFISLHGSADFAVAGGTLVAFEGFAVHAPITASSSGTYSLTINGSTLALDLVFQSLFVDLSLPRGISFTNAIRAQFGT